MTVSETPVPVTRPGASVRKPHRNARAWVANVAGTVLVGVGIGVMLLAGMGVSPLDAAFAGVARATGLTVGTVIIVASVVFVAVAWALRHPPGIGTVISFFGIGIAVDVTMMVLSPVGLADGALLVRVAGWAVGLAVFAVGVVLLIGSRLGASPYDQIVQAVAARLRISMGRSRLLFDVTALVVAFLLGGAWGVGTVVLLLTMPLVLNRALPVAHRVIHPGSR